jgi:hypothetical protein
MAVGREVRSVRRVVPTLLVLGAVIALCTPADADPIGAISLVAVPSPAYVGTFTDVAIGFSSGGGQQVAFSLDWGDGSTPTNGTVTTSRDVYHMYQAPGTFTVAAAESDSDGDLGSASIQLDVVPPPTVTAEVNGTPVFSNDPNVTVDPAAAPAGAANQLWGVRPSYPGQWSTSFDVPVELTLITTGIPDSDFLRMFYGMRFGGCSTLGCSSDGGHDASAYACGVGSSEIGILCADGTSGPQTVSMQNTFSRIGLPGDEAVPSDLGVYLFTPSGDVLLNPLLPPSNPSPFAPPSMRGSAVAVFLPPTCGGGTPLTCPTVSTKTLVLAESSVLARGFSLTTSSSKSVTYYWRQLFHGHDVFVVRRAGRVRSRTIVSGKPYTLHAHRWACPRTGKFTLQVTGRSNNGITRKMRKRTVRCP